MALSDLSGHARPSHSACTSTHVMRPSVAHGAGLGAVLFPPAPGVVRINFVWEVRPYWAAFGLSHTNCMGFSAIRFVWPNICIFPKVDRGWQNYFDNSEVRKITRRNCNFISGSHLIPLSPARPRALVTKCVVPPCAKTVPTIFFYFGARSRNNYLEIVRDLGMVHIEPFFRYGRERAAAATLTYFDVLQ